VAGVAIGRDYVSCPGEKQLECLLARGYLLAGMVPLVVTSLPVVSGMLLFFAMNVPYGTEPPGMFSVLVPGVRFQTKISDWDPAGSHDPRIWFWAFASVLGHPPGTTAGQNRSDVTERCHQQPALQSDEGIGGLNLAVWPRLPRASLPRISAEAARIQRSTVSLAAAPASLLCTLTRRGGVVAGQR
jgi:hypothetical protein